MDGLRKLRGRIAFLAEHVSRLGSGLTEGTPAIVGRVFAETALPTSAGVFYAVRPCVVTSPDTEGGTATITEDVTRKFYTRVLEANPSAGDYLTCFDADFRWHSRRKTTSSGGGITIPGCACTSSPPSINMVVSGSDATLQDCTFTWRATPASIASLGIGSESYLSSIAFIDSFTGDSFWYLLQCAISAWKVTRVYPDYFGSGTPYRDVIRFTWIIGAGANTCSPFHMQDGTIYSGGDPSVVITLDPS